MLYSRVATGLFPASRPITVFVDVRKIKVGWGEAPSVIGGEAGNSPVAIRPLCYPHSRLYCFSSRLSEKNRRQNVMTCRCMVRRGSHIYKQNKRRNIVKVNEQ